MKIESKDDLIDFIACVILATVVVGAFAVFMLYILSGLQGPNFGL